jgi:thymidylate synthase ThyX
MPFTSDLPDGVDDNVRRKVSVARCARVSYGTHADESRSIEKEVALYEQLLANKHMSPFEHVARPFEYTPYETCHQKNLWGWVTHRTEVEGEQA